ncbi:XdhC family protein [Halococcus saccharolyticus]|uniref:Xanthine and Co dehydrogenase maturation factor n=1 Tax=Halococcus saccharolyticus DSM 5350 TaxID=1227455 RepID=M0MNQ8_9EURY|nr:XdhC/CoxI family protein [Halococcus saccharolyticus]EMA47342.1 xanthine and Co dehydrogenase maturation factor [Halococcus saccharolyticus DSM 5350]
MTDTNWSVPETEVLSAVGDALNAGREAVIATVIDVEGSAYRRPGAKMVIEADESAGSVTAGCLEDEVRSIAADVRAVGEPRVETFDLTGDDGTWGLGMGCNGIITILLEPVDESYRPIVERVAEGGDVGVATVVDGDRPRGERGYYTPKDGFAGDLPDWLRAELTDPTAGLLDRGEADTLRIDRDERSVEVFVDGIEAPPHLVVFGSGPDVGPVVDLAKRAEFRVTVVGFRGAQATSEAFPAADEVVAISPANIEDEVDFDADTHAVVMTHNFVDDRLVLEALLDTPIPYIGLMGPEERFEELLDAFADDGVTLPENALDRIYTPIGLDLGGDSPYRIAYSIVAELLAVANDRTPQHLSNREGPIHDRVDSRTVDNVAPE